MIYSEASYFDGYHFAHIAARDEVERLRGIDRRMRLTMRDMVRGGRLEHRRREGDR